jgi:hypothetical protein
MRSRPAVRRALRGTRAARRFAARSGGDHDPGRRSQGRQTRGTKAPSGASPVRRGMEVRRSVRRARVRADPRSAGRRSRRRRPTFRVGGSAAVPRSSRPSLDQAHDPVHLIQVGGDRRRGRARRQAPGRAQRLVTGSAAIAGAAELAGMLVVEPSSARGMFGHALSVAHRQAGCGAMRPDGHLLARPWFARGRKCTRRHRPDLLPPHG